MLSVKLIQGDADALLNVLKVSAQVDALNRQIGSALQGPRARVKVKNARVGANLLTVEPVGLRTDALVSHLARFIDLIRQTISLLAPTAIVLLIKLKTSTTVVCQTSTAVNSNYKIMK